MALSASALSTAMRAAILGKPSGEGHLNANDNAALTELCDAFAAAVVAHITSSAVVVPTALVAPPGGGPVTGVGTIT